MAQVVKKPSAKGIWIGLILMLLGLGSCAGGCGLAVVQLTNAINNLNEKDRVDVGSSQTYDMEKNAAGVIIAFGKSSSDAKAVTATLTDPDGKDVTISKNGSMSTSQSTTTDGESTEFVGAFTADKAGTYTLASEGPEGAQVAILPFALGSFLGKIFGGLGLGAVLFLAGLVTTIVATARRSKAKKTLAAAGGGFQPPAPGGYPPAPGYSQPPAPPAPNVPGAVPPATPPTPPTPPAPGGYPPAPGAAPATPPAPTPPAPTAPEYGSPTPPPPPAPGGFPPPPPPAPPSAAPSPTDPPAFGGTGQPAFPPSPGTPAPDPNDATTLPGQWGSEPPQAPPFS